MPGGLPLQAIRAVGPHANPVYTFCGVITACLR